MKFKFISPGYLMIGIIAFVIGCMSGITIMGLIGTSNLFGLDSAFQRAKLLGYQDIQRISLLRYGDQVILEDDMGRVFNAPARAFVSTGNAPAISIAQSAPVATSAVHVENIPSNETPNSQPAGPQTSETPVSNFNPTTTLPPQHNTSIDRQVEKLRLGQKVVSKLHEFPEELMVVYPAKTETPKDTLIVFSDPSCGYCRTFHRKNLPALTEAGYEVRYIPIARPKGTNPDGSLKFNSMLAKKLQFAMCSSDPKVELDKLYNNIAYKPPAPKAMCEDVDVKGAIKLSVLPLIAARGTPAIYSYNGYASGGVSADGQRKIEAGQSDTQTMLRELAGFQGQKAAQTYR